MAKEHAAGIIYKEFKIQRSKMVADNPSIEDLITKTKEKLESDDKKYRVAQTLSDVNRAFEEKEAAAKAMKLGYSYINLRTFPVDMEALALVPKERAEKIKALVFHHEAGELKLGVVDPTVAEIASLKAELEGKKYNVKIYVISHSSLHEGLLGYNKIRSAKYFDEQKIELLSKEIADKVVKFTKFGPAEIDKIEATEILKMLLCQALNLNASEQRKWSGNPFLPGLVAERVFLWPKILSSGTSDSGS